ncbi:CRISPR-associated protein Cas5 [Campylobacter hyointestinalis]|uniref:CRISPR-associated protein Cas5 n=1 Tax=Campylobacter hyointestinalis subsp. hyointestinalis TaxID=91352 RepID=A0A855N9P8_CAMHY|nr:CRISPR-associated protein Cas5 [Campylobacter hyointestinalis]ANE32836.1 CRISPR/Cas system-associated RAMP protein Cas5, type I-B/HMARI [Campylobacter hyointestinalis subsp. hyointestinalis LMG 9260]KEA44852.1 transporter [Campylobacter hyointestinalis subsp. hyointestinalis]MDL2347097.1 CRISPR-associated protein Cas5 [Campylobacter hyointestinalis]MDL2348289.1 CRISPR-associated protein Cas5 [Campylobacter hyointestinalis]MDL2350584.1 CRISPR-associated protein Cas5 [Campylobacter hyointesti
MSGDIIAFKLTGDYAHFSHPATIYSSLTYPVPPKTTIMGLLGAVIGLDEYWELENLLYSVKINSQIRKKIFVFNGIKFALSTNFNLEEGYQNSSEKKQFYRELLCTPSYTIFLNLENVEDKFKKKIISSLREHKTAFTPYLGINFCIADFEFVEIKKCEKVTKSLVEVATFVLQEDFIFQPDNYDVRLTSSRMACKVEEGRIFKDFKDFVIEINGGQSLNAKNSGNIYEIDGDTVCFV